MFPLATLWECTTTMGIAGFAQQDCRTPAFYGNIKPSDSWVSREKRFIGNSLGSISDSMILWVVPPILESRVTYPQYPPIVRQPISYWLWSEIKRINWVAEKSLVTIWNRLQSGGLCLVNFSCHHITETLQEFLSQLKGWSSKSPKWDFCQGLFTLWLRWFV